MAVPLDPVLDTVYAPDGTGRCVHCGAEESRHAITSRVVTPRDPETDTPAVIEWLRHCYGKGPIYVGATLCDRERNYTDESDFYAIVYDAKTDTLEEIEYGSTRYFSPTACLVDATPEVKAKAREALYREVLALLKADALREAAQVEVGRVVKIVAGRKLPRGMVGEVIWKGCTHKAYSRWSEVWRVKLRFDPDAPENCPDLPEAFTAIENVAVVDPKLYATSESELMAKARSIADADWWWWVEGYWSAKAGMLVT